MENKKHTILIVDDVATNLDLLKGLLVGNYNVKVANNGPLTLKIVQKSAPDLILLDIMMPGMDGYQVCEELKRDPETRDIPVIFLTARTESEDIVKGFEAGGVDYLTKPFNPHELLARVNTQILIKEQKDLILKQNREQKELLHILSHDLANHFSVINFALSLIKSDAHKTDYLGKIKSATTHGIDIINLVREMRNLQEKSIPLERVNLYESIQESVILLGDRFESKNVELVINIEESLQVMAEKRSLINSVINNILTNALKFSYEGGQVEVVANEHDDDIVMIFEDHGIGMPANLLSQIFDISKSTSRPGTNGETGTGFGMPLIKSFVDFYGGKIEVESRDIQEYPREHGTKVSISFPKISQNVRSNL
ncbi:MAG: hybrid sensor histidine kinase/response regulator [Candidatus Marinimicrobia bacterium]|nr:hybrid sensor histidine kinase/response regulator [Candidatus Neomarinimicrobiota bacterium]